MINLQWCDNSVDFDNEQEAMTRVMREAQNGYVVHAEIDDTEDGYLFFDLAAITAHEVGACFVSYRGSEINRIGVKEEAGSLVPDETATGAKYSFYMA